MLKSKRINLRPIENRDLKVLNKWKNDYEIFKYLGGGFQPQSINEQEKYISNLINNSGTSKRFIIDNGEAIGMVGLYDINFINRNCDLGIYIGEKSEQGKGYAKETMDLILDFAFNNLNLKKIKLNVVNANNKAINLYNSLGFKEVGILKEERFINGKFEDVKIMELIKDE
ncbi:GNAT family N-acetyltransferase [Clostridium perfringens]|uniref:GNAT family N-acetyltransferase n=1 Tax=Clostridium perfringens TaxID=1502 RepID=UPI0001711CB2|nr:GNAT family protein [Clostridium perfringens]EDT27894.1 WfbC [Clostridium perfringens CPE str. F4969]EHA6440005.1 GNAT family N-acetyltransferase [Clostridium perfringens]EJT5918019.1 GNAT family N-acetyltransferase [Clostridium perfringens]EJT5940475.1 GNAT family N-acetyltransferase [Clostridium perfringens]EJT6136731.1 GNAT family N-acetyltransferase [Clostridium perfringens]